MSKKSSESRVTQISRILMCFYLNNETVARKRSGGRIYEEERYASNIPRRTAR